MPSPSFDIQSELNKHEVSNAVDQANREVRTRFDFKGSGVAYKYEGNSIILQAETNFQLKQMIDILKNKFAKRHIDVAHMKLEDPIIQHKSAQQIVMLLDGIDQITAKKIIKLIKDQKLKVQVAIQGEKVRVTGKKRDDLQSVIGLLKEQEIGLPLQFDNFRD
ncbi:YajQ family cyclic di-GMP-binding protein [Coxiella endosymbiont of Ornithodoros maritimus]|uniref:YajQ family cyclic di-GMP-binding protein n=1 Tax=Coxiella endosymbiont of Ornithodoros maritimus TaxID=1656172 RepID=UPI002264C6AD|nr:YajQ family cyclic di-GMP-binding protein [Coxiella endosymbiont of Ornithodoros maritimus]